MDYKIIFSDPAIGDLENIVRFISHDDHLAAVRFGNELMESVWYLARFPRLGRVVPELNDGNIREIVFKSYRVFYRVKDEARIVEIIRFWHAARGSPNLPK